MLQWLMRLFPRRPRVVVDGKGYRVNGEWCGSQVAVRQRLEQLGLAEAEIIRMLRDLNLKKYGNAHR
ncbi:MAG TPA: hypothetical protein VGK74_28140 [Symbiobacteriaceae bacterium]|jgi:Fe2+ transport system protein FeoA